MRGFLILALSISAVFADTIQDESPNVQNEFYSVWYDATNQTGYIGAIDTLYKTTDGGTNWNAVNINTSCPGAVKRILMKDKDNGFILTDSGICYTSDGFTTIATANMDITTSVSGITAQYLSLEDMDLLPPCSVAISSIGTVYLSWDGGYNYIPSQLSLLTDYTLKGIAMIGCFSEPVGSGRNIHTFDFVVAGGRVLSRGGFEGIIASVRCTVDDFYLTVSCSVWAKNTYPGEFFYGLYRFDGEYYATGENGGIYLSIDTINWQRMGTNAYNALYTVLKRRDGKLYAGGQNILQIYENGRLVDNISLVDNFTDSLNGAIYGIHITENANTGGWEGFAVGIKSTFNPLLLRIVDLSLNVAAGR